jgi:hypothetical protein
MEIAMGLSRAITAGILAPFSGHNAMVSLVPIAVLLAMGMLWVFKVTSNREAIDRIKRRLHAHLYEMRLFTEEPALIWQAQVGLISANIRYLARMLAPAVVMAIPMVVIFAQLECFYGHTPLQPGQDAIVTVGMKPGPTGAAPELRPPAGITVESPAVSVDGGREISWRVRALQPVSGELQFAFPTTTITKSIQAGTGPTYLSERRVSSALDLVLHPGESQIPSGPVDWIELSYPNSTVHALGIDLNWLVWMLILSMVAALLLKRRFRVSF